MDLIVKKVLIIFIGLLIFGTLSHLISGPSSSQAKATASTPEDQQAQAAELQERIVLAKAALVLRKGMKNPPSFFVTSALVTEQKAMCFEYRATNGFGGTVPGYTAISPSGKFITAPIGWNKYCAGKKGVERSTEINDVLKKNPE